MSSKTSGLTEAVTLANSDLLMVVVNANTATPANRKLQVWKFLGMLPANTHLLASLTVDGNATFEGPSNFFGGNTTVHGVAAVRNLVVANSYLRISSAHSTPANSASVTAAPGTIFWSANNLYITTATNYTKRIPLQEL